MSHEPLILVADDDSNDVFLLRRAFRQICPSCTVLDVSDGERAVDYLSGHAPFEDPARFPVPDLLLLDVKMPKMNGFDVLAWLTGRPHLDQLPVIVLSGSSFEADSETARHLGAREFLTKPNDLEELAVLVKGIYSRWLAKPPEPEFIFPALLPAMAAAAAFWRLSPTR